MMTYTARESVAIAGAWEVLGVDHQASGPTQITVFCGADAERRARAYVQDETWKVEHPTPDVRPDTQELA